VGPVRSARSTDLFLLAELGRPLFAWSGANPTFAAAVEAADLIDVGVAAVPDAYERSDERRAPYDLFAAPAELRAAAEGEAGAATPPRALFTYRPEGEPLAGPGVEPAAGFTTTGAGGLATEITWEWDEDAGARARTPDGAPHVDGRAAGRRRGRGGGGDPAPGAVHLPARGRTARLPGRRAGGRLHHHRRRWAGHRDHLGVGRGRRRLGPHAGRDAARRRRRRPGA